MNNTDLIPENTGKSRKMWLFAPFIGILYICVVSFFEGMVEDKIPGFTGFLLSTLIAIASLAGAVYVYQKLLKSNPPSDGERSPLKGEFASFVVICCGTVLLYIVTEGLLYLLLHFLSGANLVPYNYTPAELKEDLPASFHAVLIAPALEELCFRVIPIRLTQNKKQRIILLVVSTILFAVLHGDNMIMAGIEGLLMGCLYIYTNRARYNIAMHIFKNLISTIFAVLSTAGISTIFVGDANFTILLMDFATMAIMSGLALLVAGICIIKGRVSH